MTKHIFFVVITLMATVSLHAQTTFGFGLQKELFGVSLNGESADDATFSVDKVDFAVLLQDHLRIGMGVQGGTQVNHETKRYEPGAGLALSFAYLFDFKNYKDFAIAPTLSVGNSFKDFKSFQNVDIDLGVRSYLFNSVFLGTGVRYAHWSKSPIINDSSCYSWYWEIGYNLYFKSRKK